MRMKKYYLVVFIIAWIGIAIILLFLQRSNRNVNIPHIANFQSPLLKQAHGSPTLLSDLGFVFNPRLFPQSYHDELSDLPVFVGAVSSDILTDFLHMVSTLRIFYPDKKLVVYNMNLDREEQSQLRSGCRCVIRDVKWQHFPKHVKDPVYKAYRPVLIQKALMEFGAVFWVESTVRFTSAEIFSLQSQAERVGVVAWPLNMPTSALTHYHTFRYLNTSHEKYYFHRMMETDGIIVYNTEKIHKHLMLPWVKCALDSSCLAPPDAKPTPCNLNKHPKYLYAGCHRYDASAFNVVLGQAYMMQEPYIALLDIYKVIAHGS